MIEATSRSSDNVASTNEASARFGPITLSAVIIGPTKNRSAGTIRSPLSERQ